MITKTDYEEIYLFTEFRRGDGYGWLGPTETISTANVTIVDRETGTDTTATMISNVSVVNSTRVRYKLKAGVSGKTYDLSVAITTNLGQKFEDLFSVTVI